MQSHAPAIANQEKEQNNAVIQYITEVMQSTVDAASKIEVVREYFIAENEIEMAAEAVLALLAYLRQNQSSANDQVADFLDKVQISLTSGASPINNASSSQRLARRWLAVVRQNEEASKSQVETNNGQRFFSSGKKPEATYAEINPSLMLCFAGVSLIGASILLAVTVPVLPIILATAAAAATLGSFFYGFALLSTGVIFGLPDLVVSKASREPQDTFATALQYKRQI